MTLRMRVLPRFPAKIFGSTGIKITRPTGSTDLTVSLDVSDIVRVPSVADNNKVFFLAWNSDLNTYSIMSFADTFAAVVDSEGFMLQSVYDPEGIEGDAFDRANHTGQQTISTITNLQASLNAKVAGPASATDGAFAAFDGTTGKLIKVLSAASALALIKTAGAYAKDNVVGTVSQSAGVPTGGIIEKGSNANGSYVRFADGSQLCWHSLVLGYLDVINMFGTWTYPAAFASTPNIQITATQAWSGVVRNYGMKTRVSSKAASSALIIAINDDATNINGDTYTVEVYSAGRWF